MRPCRARGRRTWRTPARPRRPERLLLTAGFDGLARLWSLETGQPVGEPIRHRQWLASCALSPDGRWLATGSRKGTVRVFEAATGRPVAGPIETSGPVARLAFATKADGGLALVAEAATHRTFPWTPPEDEQVGLDVDGAVLQGHRAFAEEEEWEAFVLVDHDVRAWDLGTLTGHAGPAATRPTTRPFVGNQLALLPGGRAVINEIRANEVWVADCATGALVLPPLKHANSAYTAAASPSERLLAAFDSNSNEVVIWDLTMGTALSRFARRWGPSSRVIEFSADERHVLISWSDGMAQEWDVATGRPAGPELRHKGRVATARYMPDGRHILTASFDGTARLWDRRTGAPVGNPMTHDGRWGLGAGPDRAGRLIWTATDRRVRIGEASTQRLVAEVPVRGSGLAGESTAFSPDSRRVLINHGEAAIVVDAATGQRLLPPFRHDDEEGPVDVEEPPRVGSASWSPAGDRILTAGSDGTVRVWDAATGLPIARFALPDVRSATFSTDGRRVYAARWSDAVGGAWPLEPPTRDVAALKRPVERTAGQRLDEQGTLVRLTGEAYRQRAAD